MKKRSMISDKYKWDTSHIYATEEELNKDIDYLKSQIKVIESYKGKLNNKKDILKFFKLSSEIDKVEEKVGAYIYLNHSENLETQKYVQLLNFVDGIESELSVASSFEESELLNNGVEFLNSLLEDKEFKNYHLGIKELIRNSKHVLSEVEESIVSKAINFAGGFSRVFDNIDALDVKFKDFEIKDS